MSGTWSQLLSTNLNDWMHAALLYIRAYWGVAEHANSTHQCSLASFLLLRDDWDSQVRPLTSLFLPLGNDGNIRN